MLAALLDLFSSIGSFTFESQFGYDVHGVDAYGNPNEHSRTEVREGPIVKGENIFSNNNASSSTLYSFNSVNSVGRSFTFA